MRLPFVFLGLVLSIGCAAPVERVADEESEETVETEAPIAIVPQALGLPNGLQLVVPNERPFVVLDVPAEPLAAGGPIELVSQPEELSWSVASYRPLDVATSGERWVLYGPKGAVCRVVADELGLLNRSGLEEAFGWKERPDAEDRLERAWEIGAAGQLFTARTSRTEGDCSAARFALPETAARPRIWSKQATLSVALARGAVADFRLLPEWHELQAELESFWEDKPGKPGSWDEYDGAHPVATLWRDAEGGNELVLVDAHAGAGCGDFGGSLWALLEPTRGGFVPRAVGRFENVPDLVLDANRDGRLELFSGGSITFDDEDEPRAVSIEVPDDHCPC